MRKFPLIIAIVFVIAGILSLSFIHPHGRNSIVNGGGSAMEGGVKSTFVFNAINQNGNVNGHLVYHLRVNNTRFFMQLDCMQIDGNRATLSGTVTEVSGSNIPYYIYPGASASFTVEDNGKGGDKDRISDVVFGAQCSDDLNTYLSIQGNLTVKE